MMPPIRTMLAALAAAVLLLATAAPAQAHHTVMTVGGTSSPTGSVPMGIGQVTDVSFTTEIGMEIWCESLVGSGTVERGAVVEVDSVVAAIDTLVSNPWDCIMFGLLDVTLTLGPGEMRVLEHPTQAGDPLLVRIEIDDAQVSGTGCHFTFDGHIDAWLTPATVGDDGRLELVPADFSGMDHFDLTISVPGGGHTCGGQVSHGHTAGAHWSYQDFMNPANNIPSILALDTLGAGAISHG